MPTGRNKSDGGKGDRARGGSLDARVPASSVGGRGGEGEDGGREGKGAGKPKKGKKKGKSELPATTDAVAKDERRDRKGRDGQEKKEKREDKKREEESKGMSNGGEVMSSASHQGQGSPNVQEGQGGVPSAPGGSAMMGFGWWG